MKDREICRERQLETTAKCEEMVGEGILNMGDAWVSLGGFVSTAGVEPGQYTNCMEISPTLSSPLVLGHTIGS